MENKSKAIKIALTILIALLVGYSGWATYQLVKNREQRTENNENETKNEQEEVENEQSTTNNNGKETTVLDKEYTHPNYPDLVIRYDNSWTLSTVEKSHKEAVNPYEPGSPEIDVTELYIKIAKNNVEINIDTFPISMWGSAGGTLHTKDEIEIVKIGDDWVRISNDEGYYYAPRNNVIIRTEETQKFNDFIDMSFYEEPYTESHEYVIYDGAGIIGGIYHDTDEGYESFALISVKLKIDGEVDNETVEKADQIILQSTFSTE